MIKKNWHYIIPIIIIIGFFGYKSIAKVGIEEISTDQLAELMSKPQDNTFFVDVREPHEFEEGHIEGMANVPLSQLETNVHLIPSDQKVVIICRSGNRSLQAANKLKELGYKDLVHVKGGMLAWKGEVKSY